MKYDKYTYLWPPRPSDPIPIKTLHFYEQRGWVAQMKKNGTCTVLFVSPEKEIIVKTRHNDEHKRWAPTEKSTHLFKTLPGAGWYVFVCEVLHSKTATVKDTVYIFDILVNDGELLIGSTFIERMEMLKKLFGIRDDGNVVSLSNTSHYVLSSNIWLARTITSGFEQIMRIANRQKPTDGAPVDEGIVLKNPTARLEMPGKQTSNSKWMVKCRVDHKNYKF